MSSIGPVVTEEKMFENVDGRTDDGRRRHWSAQNGGHLKPGITVIFTLFTYLLI